MSKFIIIGIVVLVIAGGGILFLGQGGEQQKTTSTGTKNNFQTLTFVDYDGNSVALADFAGKPLVVNAWAAWCPFCVKELPDFTLLQKEFPDVVVIAIDRSESLNTAKSYTDDLGITDSLMFLLDSSDSFYRSIGGFTMPETIFVDKDGVIQIHKRGIMSLDEMKSNVEKIL
ncbi:TlpA family protein disulfide reductase [Patescibacteria group bacterium]|nr:TlpA family protein disulfide reductase [Patescibacteria group bacterium]